MLLAGLVASQGARAQPTAPDSRIVAIDTDSHFDHALELALTSWRVDVSAEPGPAPGRDIDDAIRTAHRIARRDSARAVVWMTSAELWVYDERTHQIAVRPLPSPPPYDEATAAAIALTVKTVLGGTPDAHPQTETTTEVAPPPPTPKPASAKHSVRIHTFGGARVPTNASDAIAARFGAEITYFPAPVVPWLGLALSADAGPSVLIEREPLFVGTFTDTATSVSVRLRVPLRKWFALEAGAGPGIHFSAIEGTAPSTNVSGRVSRIDASVEAMVGFELAWKTIRVAPLLSSTFLVHYQRYRVGPTEVLEVPPAQMLFALRLGVELP